MSFHDHCEQTYEDQDKNGGFESHGSHESIEDQLKGSLRPFEGAAILTVPIHMDDYRRNKIRADIKFYLFLNPKLGSQMNANRTRYLRLALALNSQGFLVRTVS